MEFSLQHNIQIMRCPWGVTRMAEVIKKAINGNAAEIMNVQL